MLFSLWNGKKKEPDAQNTCCANISAHIEGLKSGQENHLAALYPMLLSEDKASAETAAEAIHTYMSRLKASDIISLDRRFRQYTSMEWCVDWTDISPGDMTSSISSQEERLSILRLGTLHPNGHFREKCMTALAKDEASFGYITLRLNDWAKPVRDAAYNILSGRLDMVQADTAVGMLPFFGRTRKGGRYTHWQVQEIEAKLSERLLLCLEDISLDKIREYPPATKRFLYDLLISPEVLSRTRADRLLQREKNGNEKARILRLILKNYECSDAEIEHYLTNKSPVVRKKALEVKYKRLGNAWTGLEDFLLDTSKSIRSDASYILRRHTAFDILSFYKAHLHTPKESEAILGIGENGAAEDGEILEEYLYAQRPRLIKNAMKALSKLGVKGLDDIYWTYLNDADISISKAAYMAVCRSNIYYGAEELYQAYRGSKNAASGKYLLYLLMREPSWDRLPWLMLLYDPDAGASDRMQTLVQRGLLFRNVYARITKRQADFIIRTMNAPECGITEKMKKEILFDLKHIAVV